MAESDREIYGRLWTEKFAALYEAERAAEDTRRAEAFVDSPRLVAGLLLRPITAYDIHMLDGHEFPLVTGKPETLTGRQLAGALWFLRADLGGKRCLGLRRWIFINQMDGLYTARDGMPTPAFFAASTALLEHIEFAYTDSEAPKKIDAKTGQPVPVSRERGTSWLASLLTSLACEMGPFDPATGKPWMQSPLARLWQYMKIIRARNSTNPAGDHSASKRYRGMCMGEARREIKRRKDEAAAVAASK